jgi:hypothetical protein
LHDANDRIPAAIPNSGRTWPNERIVLALSPASLRKTGSGFDLSWPVRSCLEPRLGAGLALPRAGHRHTSWGWVRSARRRSTTKWSSSSPRTRRAGLHVYRRLRQAPPHRTVIVHGNVDKGGCAARSATGCS